jgi:hypothetical protein
MAIWKGLEGSVEGKAPETWTMGTFPWAQFTSSGVATAKATANAAPGTREGQLTEPPGNLKLRAVIGFFRASLNPIGLRRRVLRCLSLNVSHQSTPIVK